MAIPIRVCRLRQHGLTRVCHQAHNRGAKLLGEARPASGAPRLGGLRGLTEQTMARRRYEGSPKDLAEDRKGARKLGVGLKAYERTARDRREDTKGQKKLVERGKK
jgi:hypothetical protein